MVEATPSDGIWVVMSRPDWPFSPLSLWFPADFPSRPPAPELSMQITAPEGQLWASAGMPASRSAAVTNARPETVQDSQRDERPKLLRITVPFETLGRCRKVREWRQPKPWLASPFRPI